jgi:hypothetical protein
VELDADFGAPLAHRVLEDVGREARSRDRPVDQVERRYPFAFAKLLELAQLGDVIERKTLTRDRLVPVELFLGVDSEQEALAEIASEPRPSFRRRDFGDGSDCCLGA